MKRREHIHAYTEKKKSIDPTKTTMLRAQFVTQMNKRFTMLSAVIRKSIVDEDCFGLMDTPVEGLSVNQDLPTAGRKRFNFPLTQDKIDGFMEWLRLVEKWGILEIPQLGSAVKKPWTNLYIQTAYQKGVESARRKILNAGYEAPTIEEEGGIEAVFNQFFHVDRVGLLYSRAFNELKGVTDYMDQQISRTLAQGLADGKHPRLLVAEINQIIKGETLVRARMIARTETVRAHHVATIQEYRNWGVAGVTVMAEWVTAGYNVCPECLGKEKDKDGKRIRYTLDEIEGLIPLHPNCRCSTIPLDITDGIPEPEITPEPKKKVVKKATKFTPAETAEEAIEWAKVNLGLTDNETQLNVDALNEINSALFNARKTFNFTVRKYAVDNRKRVWASAGGVRMSFNPKYWNDLDFFMKDIKDAIGQRYHPIGTASFKAVVDHEIAHNLTSMDIHFNPYSELVKKLRSIKRRWTREMNKLWKTPKGQGKASANIRWNEIFISGYARDSLHEFVAEALTMAMNSPNPSPYALEVYEVLKEYKGYTPIKL